MDTTPVKFYSLNLPGILLAKTPPGNTVEVKREPGQTGTTIFVRNNRVLLIYELTNGSWKEVHTDEKFFSVPNDNANYPWAVYEGGLLAVRKTKGIVVYKWSRVQVELKQQLVALQYHDEYGYGSSENTILFGKIFPSEKYIGIVSRLSSTVEFRSIDPGASRKPVRSLKKALNLDPAWTDPASTISLVERYDSKTQVSIALRTASELKLFRFNDLYELKELATVKELPPLDREYDKIMFVKFDNAKINDLLHFSTQGLTMYRRNEGSGVFEKVYYSTVFSKLRGWNRRTIETISPVDIDGDKLDELICSGPKGLCLYRPVFTDDGFDLVNIFDETIEDHTMRYGLPRLVTKDVCNDTYNLLLFTGKNLVSVQTKLFTPQSNAIPTVEEVSDKPNPIVPIVVPQKKYNVWLHDQLDLNNMLQPLNPHAGTVELSIPLIELPNSFGVSVRKFFQYKNIPFESFFGQGWSLALDYISVERKNSVFAQDHDYAILKNNNRILLKRYQQWDSVFHWEFRIEGYKAARIKYFYDKERWEMSVEDRTLVYGTWGQLSKIRQEQVCATWPLCGDKSDKVKNLPTRWYLVHEENNYGPCANYFYDEMDAQKGDRLSRIELDSGSSVALKYSDKNMLTSFSVNTTSYEQNVFFEYKDNFLTHIRQDDSTLFRFEYKNQRMSKIVYPNSLETTLEYSDMAIDRERFQEIIPVDLSPTIYYGPDYTVIMDKEYEDDRMVISIRNLLGGTDGPKVTKSKLYFGQPGIKSHMIHAIENLMVIVLIYGSHKEVSILQFTNDGWIEKEYHGELPLDAVVGVGARFVALCDLKNLRVLTINHQGKLISTEVKKTVPKNFLLYAFVNGFVFYGDDIGVWTLGYRDTWNKGSTPKPTDIFADIEKMITSFNVNAEFRTAVRKGFLADAMIVHQNAIVLRVPVLTNQVLELKVIFLIMNYDRIPKVVSTQEVRIPIANFKTYEYDVPTKDGDVFKMHYVQENKKLILKLKSMKGPLAESLEEQRQKSYKQINDSKEKADKKAKYKKEVDEKIAEEEGNIRRTVIDKIQFAMDLSQFGVLSNQHGIVTGNKQLTYDGKTWMQTTVGPETMRMEQVDQMLGEGFRLVKNGAEDTFKVFEMPQNKLAYDTQTNNPQEIQIVAPRYIQAQPAKKPLRLFFFKTKEIVQLPVNETLVRASNTIAVVTVHHVNETSKFTLFRPVNSFLLKQTTLFTKQKVQLAPDETRTTAYIYDVKDVHLSSEGAMFYRMKVSPGDDTKRYGWYERMTDPHTGVTTRKSFAYDGTDVTVREKKKHSNSEVKDLHRTIRDKSRQLKIVDLGSLKLSDEVASYYGFEQYEVNLYGKDKKWLFDEKQVQSEHKHDSNRYLKLTAGSSLKATFSPKEPRNLWIVSFWVRSVKPLKEGDLFNGVKIDLNNAQNNSLQTVSGAKVQHITANWCYVELIVDTTKTPEDTKLTFDVTIEPTASETSIDVDHVRFSPLDLNFRANVYTPITAEMRAMLNNNGMMKQSLYSPTGRRVALLSENGQVIDFAMHSKTAYAARVKARYCLVEMKPREGEYDTFNAAHWKTNQPSEWQITYGVLEYKNDRADKRGDIVRTFDQPFESIALRFLYRFQSGNSKLAIKWNSQEVGIICSPGTASCPRPPNMGEVLIFITALRVSVWLEGHLLSERLLKPPGSMNRNEFRLLPTGSFEITEFLVMYDSRVKVTHHNLMGRPVQVVEYDDPKTVRVREIVYDNIDRPTMHTKWTKLASTERKEFFGFYENFITQIFGSSNEMHGMVANAHPSCEGYPYSHTIYANDPTENKQFQGLPGKEYTVTGKYKRRYAMRSEIPMLSILFPEADGYRQKVIERPGGAIRVTVEDERGNKVAKYSQVGNYEHRLTTYRYSDSYGYLYEVLPPQYHLQAKTYSRTRPFNTAGITPEEARFKDQWEVRYLEDEGKILFKRTPDGGSYEYVYTESGILRYSLHFNSPDSKNLDRVIHFTYASNGKVMREALVNLTRERCYELAESNEAPESDNLIETFYGEVETNPLVRYRSQQSTRRIANNQMIESLIFNEHEKVIKKIFVVPTINTTYSIDYEYENGNLHSLKYPVDSPTSSFSLVYDYNGHGEVKSIRELTKRDPMFEFTYNADGMVETMKVRTDANHAFQRNFTYNEPGFLVKLEDDYLSETVSYVETDSYGQDSYTPIYEGLISKTSFTAHWQKSASPLRNGIYPDYFISKDMDAKRALLCHGELKRTGYLDENNLVNRTFYGERDDDLPFVCGNRIPLNHLSEVLSSRSFPYEYGHRYDYDDHDQLIKAKYFHGLDELQLLPLTHRTFSKEITGINEATSTKIWDVLRKEQFLTMDCTNPNLCHGREGTRPVFADFIQQHPFSHHLKTMLIKAVAERKALTTNALEAMCKRWVKGSNMIAKTCADVKAALETRKILDNSADSPLAALSDTFKDALKSYKNNIPDIVRVLGHHFTTALGRSAGDVQSYEIDANGNHKKFYTGFSRYRLEYREGTNQITKLHRQYFDREQRTEDHFNLEHNSDGAVVKAEHKGIKSMEYDRILHRVNKIEMNDGRKLLYQYDVRSERTFKQVLDKDESVLSEKYYIRDANGIVLVDMDMTYLAKDQPPDVRVTSYIYKDQQLVGFLRNDKLYGVITDHEGSVRLVVRDGEVVAAYDYLPYGQIFRRFGTDLDGQIAYLYTGQEWEPETGLYNYRARLYDPDIGRFYQMDPKEQYPSPYVYAGNSPVALVDPDGEFAFALTVLIMALVGAYLGAATANNCWNPLKWDWKSSSTWLGMLTGAVTGASIPFNMASSVAFFMGMGLSLSTSIAIMVGTGITFAYFTMAASSGTWDPTKFDYTSPGTWNALMNGVATSSWILMNPSSLISSFVSITSLGAKALFFVAKLTMSLGFTYLFAALSQGGEFDVTKWDYSDPQLYMSIVDGFTTATVGVLFLRNIPKQISKWSGKVKRTMDLFVGNLITFRAQLMLGNNWSRAVLHTSNFLYVNFRNMQSLQKGFLTVGFYSLIVSLRMSGVSASAIPEYTAAESAINALFTTEQFSDFIVKPLSPATPKLMLPRPPNLLRSLRFRIRSEAIQVGNDSVRPSGEMYASSASSLGSLFDAVFKLSFEWLFTTNVADEKVTPDSSISTAKKAQPKNSSRSAYSLKNCYKITDDQHPNGVVSCYGHSTTVTILPKLELQLRHPEIEGKDHYKSCVPLTLEGHPSVSCDGEWSSLVYTAKETTRVFDFVDGWLLLGQVAPAAYRELKRGIKYVFSRPQPCKQEIDRETLKTHSTILQCKLNELKSQTSASEQLCWARWAIEDLTEEINAYLTKGLGSFPLLEERLNTLLVELHEERLVQQMPAPYRDFHEIDTSLGSIRKPYNDWSSVLHRENGGLQANHHILLSHGSSSSGLYALH
ncbi:uncharacterized protein LOC128726189 [Anopheles nili]|uniref:uncharacterized protein LOC128726189 n=1 Tax=Anopheles nili TaxID=185578 RepID=UPI00237B870B|nr:uncharacterized protein LOC128726189 [Anopheles nili]